MNKSLITHILILFSFLCCNIQTYAASNNVDNNSQYEQLWMDVDRKVKDDLPRDVIKLIKKISKKAEAENSYGNLLASMFYEGYVMNNIDPDSMEQYVKRWETELKRLEEKESDKVMIAVFHTSLANVYNIGYVNAPDSANQMSQKHLNKALADLTLLHNVKVDDYLPLAYDKSKWKEEDLINSGNTLLDVIVHQFEKHELLANYYDSIGDLGAACREKVFIYRNADFNKQSVCDNLKADINKYESTEECALLAHIYYRYVIRKDYKIDNNAHSSAKNKELYEYLKNAELKWKDSRYVNILKNAMSRLVSPAYNVSIPQDTPLLIGKPVKFYVNNIKNLPSLKYKLTQLNVDENTKENLLRNTSSIHKLKKEKPVIDITKTYPASEPWEEFYDSIIVNSLAPGVYVFEAYDKEKTEELTTAKVIRITDIAVITRTLSKDSVQFISVSASTGKVLPNVSLKLSISETRDITKIYSITTNSQGKALFVMPSKRASDNIRLYAYTPNDKGYERENVWIQFSNSKYINTNDNSFVFTDRRLYRPGQVVKASVTVYNSADENKSYVCKDKEINISVNDAVGENIFESRGITDFFGSASFEIPIPKDKRNGQYSIEITEKGKSGMTSIGYSTFNVEEYKRPTFEVKLDEYNKELCAFDSTKVAENGGFRILDVEGTVLTSNKLPVRKNKVEYKITRRKPWYYRYSKVAQDEYLVEGEVTTNQEGRFMIPVTLKLEEGSKGYYAFEVAVKVTNDNGETQEASTLIRAYATKEEEMPKDKEETTEIPVEHFKATANEFGPNGEPVCIELGSCLAQITVYFNYISETGIKKEGTILLSNEIKKIPITYDKAYGEALNVNYIWVKDGVSHSFSHTIKKPVRDHQLRYHWASIRDMSTPGAKESWLLKVDNNKGRAVQLDATLYDKSLDQILEYNNNFTFSNNHCYIYNTNDIVLLRNYLNYSYKKNYKQLKELQLNAIGLNQKFFNRYFTKVFYALDNVKTRISKTLNTSAKRADTIGASDVKYDAALAPAMSMKLMAESATAEEAETVGVDLSSMVRKTLAETAYYTSLKSDINGNILLNFNLPEDITTWQFRGFLHDNLMNYAFIDTTCVVRKAVMIKPNIPRYIRKGDKCYVSSVITNCIEEDINAKVIMQVYDGREGIMLQQQSTDTVLKKDDDTSVSFLIDSSLGEIMQDSLMIRIAVISDKGEDGEQHIVPVLPSYEEVITSLPFTIHGKGAFKHDIKDMLIEGSTDRKARLEYISNAAWTMIEELPKLQIPAHNDAVSLASAIYASILSRSIIEELDIKDTTFINNSCWNADSLNAKIDALKTKLIVLQNSDGSWSWWKGMDGSVYMSACVARILSRLSYMVNVDTPINAMIARTMEYLEKKVSKEVVELKKLEKKKVKQLLPSDNAIEYLYCTTLLADSYTPSAQTVGDIKYLLKLMEKDTRVFNIYGKAHTATILAYYKKGKTAETLMESMIQYSVCTDEAGRYFDTPKAYYSWRNYKIPTQVAAIETLLRLKPNEKQTIDELQRWLLHEKRTQKWDCNLNTVDAVCAFLATGKQGDTKYFKNIALDTLITSIPKGVHEEVINIEEKRYVEVTHDKENTTLWGAIYVSQVAPLENIMSTESGFMVKREILNAKKTYSVGDKITVRLTIDADRDYDFVEINDGKASCLEPLNNISGYANGCYIEIKDEVVNYYFDKFRKGRHIIENEYYIDHKGEFISSPCNVRCAYAPEFRGNTQIMKINVE